MGFGNLNRSFSLLFFHFVCLADFSELLLHVVVQFFVARFVGVFIDLDAYYAFTVSAWIVLCVLGHGTGL